MPRWLKRLLSAPNVIYNGGLGRIFGNRFLQLTHTGRKTGRTYQVVVEVVRYDRATGEAVVMSGLGRLAGFTYRGTDVDRERLVGILPLIGFTPRQSPYS